MDKETQQEFVKIRTEFSEYQREFNKKIDDLFDEIRKPLFSLTQIIGIIVSIIVYTFYITNDFSSVKSTANTNKENIEKTTQKIDKIYDIVFEMNKNYKK